MDILYYKILNNIHHNFINKYTSQSYNIYTNILIQKKKHTILEFSFQSFIYTIHASDGRRARLTM